MLPGNARNDADGKVTFGDIVFTKAGTYTVTVREVRGADPKVSYDSHAYAVTYTVTDDAAGTLTAAQSAATGASVFTNTYYPDAVTAAAPAVTKTLTGRALAADEFEFTMTALPSEGVTLPGNVRNDADGKVAFGDIVFTAAGTYTVTIREVKGADANVTYDEHAYTVTYTVTSDAAGELTVAAGAAEPITFANTYSEPTATEQPASDGGQSGEGSGSAPSTGDENEPGLWAALAGGCMAALAAVLTLCRRKERS